MTISVSDSTDVVPPDRNVCVPMTRHDGNILVPSYVWPLGGWGRRSGIPLRETWNKQKDAKKCCLIGI